MFSAGTQPKDFSLKEGEKLTLSIKGVSNKNAAGVGAAAQNKPKTGGLKKLAPPGGPKPAASGSQ